MKIKDKKELLKFNFSDFNVMHFQIDKNDKSITIKLDGALIKKSDTSIKLSKGSLNVRGYDSIQITSYDAPNDNEINLSEDDYEILRQICEIVIEKDVLIIKGFAINTFHWIEFKIKGGYVFGEFN